MNDIHRYCPHLYGYGVFKMIIKGQMQEFRVRKISIKKGVEFYTSLLEDMYQV
jgi:hypothetical protein